MDINNSIGLLTIIKNEHDFINPWIEYYSKIGIDYFYLLIDNSTYKQDEYIIDPLYKDIISIYYIDNLSVCNSGTIHLQLNRIISQIKENWTFMAAPDMYYYFNGKSLKDMVQNIKPECTQVAIPWIAVFNIYDENIDNLLENINLFKNNNHDHTSPIGRTKYIKELSPDSHNFISNRVVDIILIEGKYYNYKGRINVPRRTYEIFRIAHTQATNNKYTITNYKHGVFFHIQLRNLNEIFVKDFFSWKNYYCLNKNVVHFRNIIKFKDNYFHGFIESHRFRYIMDDFVQNLHDSNYNLNIPTCTLKNTTTYYTKLINQLLTLSGTSSDEFNKWKQNIVIYLKYKLNVNYSLLDNIPYPFDVNKFDYQNYINNNNLTITTLKEALEHYITNNINT